MLILLFIATNLVVFLYFITKMVICQGIWEIIRIL